MKQVKREMYGTGRVAQLLGMPTWRLIQLMERGKLPEPVMQVPGRRLFTQQDVERIRKAMAAKN